MYLLDTNICVYAINGRYPSVSRYLLRIPPDHIFLSSITIGELEYGAAKSRWGDKTRQIMHAFLANFRVLDFTEQDTVLFGQLRASLTSLSTPIGAYDVMIAAQSISRHLTVVTHNTGEFSRVPGISLEDWVSDEPVQKELQ
ncbi:MAG: type II toxin-antitoxin system VapC family toxin [Lachnospiraceae bacterium]|nr:type II toxin-antitoxin system VapC family toxin [Lachnospiraceae bacterium]